MMVASRVRFSLERKSRMGAGSPPTSMDRAFLPSSSI